MVAGVRPLTPAAAMVRVAAVTAVLALPGVQAAAQTADPTGSWRTITTAHFNVHVRESMLATGAVAAAEAESAHVQLSQHIAPPRGRIDLVVADHFDISNGLASTYPVPRIVVFAAPPAADPQLGVYDRWLRLVILHELAHIFHLEPARGWWSVARSLFGRAPPFFPNQYSPGWLIEGLAVHYESQLTGAGRQRSAYNRMTVAAEHAERGPLPLDAAGGLSPRWPGGIRPYVFGAAFFESLAQGHGDSAVGRLVAKQSAQLLPYVMLPRAVGQAGGDLRRAWAGIGAAPGGVRPEAGPGRVLAAGLRSHLPARAFPGGGSMAFIRDDGTGVAKLVELDAGGEREIAAVPGATGLSPERSGAVVVSRLEFVNRFEVRSDLWRISPDGRATRLTHGARLQEPDASPVDDAIVAVRLVPGGNELVLFEAGEVRVVVPAAAGTEWSGPRFGADGQLIAAVRVRSGRHDIVLVERGGAVVRSITDDAALDIMPAWFGNSDPGGPGLLWVREVDGVPTIVGERLGGSAPAFVAARSPFGAWAPESRGDSLLYLAWHADGLRLTAAAIGTEPLALAPGGDQAVELAPQVMPAQSTSYNPWPSLRPHYWLPFITAGAGATWLGAFSSGQDVLGRWSWSGTLQVGAGVAAGNARGVLSVRWDGSRAVGLDAYWSRDQFVRVDSAGRTSCCLLDETIELGATTTRRRWRSALAARGLVSREQVGAGVRWGMGASLSGGTAVRPALGISLQEGVRGAVSVRRRWREGSGRSSTEYAARGAAYQAWPSGGSARQVTALRVAAGAITGDDPLAFSVGGSYEEAVVLFPGVAFGGSRWFPLRGAVAGEYAARRVATASLEHRVPLALVGRGLPWLLPAELDRVSFTLFADGAAVRNGTFTGTLAAAGAEVVLDLGAGGIPVRLRTGFAQRLDRNARRLYVAGGSAF